MKEIIIISLTTSLLSFTCVFFLGCATAGNTPPAATINQRIPNQWTHNSETTSKAASWERSTWWQQFKDPILSSLIAEALQNNTDIRSALSSIRQARAERGLANAQLWPSIDASAGASGSHLNNLNTNNTSSSESYSGGIDASWEVDLFGQQAKYSEASEAELAASVEDFHDAQVSLAAEVATAYINLRAYEIQLGIVQENLSTRESTLEIIQWQEQAGEGDALSTQQSLSTVEQARAQIPAWEQSIQEIRNSLATLVGRTPAELASLQSTAKLPQAPAQLTLMIPAVTLSQRPDLRSAERHIEAAAANLTATERSRLPSLNLTGYIGIEALKAGDWLDPEQIISNAIASLSAPIWDAGRISRNIEIQKETLTQAYLNYESEVLAALAEVENALSSIDQLNQELAILQRASTAASKATELAQMQYESGEADLLTLLDTQRTELSLDQDRISTQAEVLQAHVKLYKALGGG